MSLLGVIELAGLAALLLGISVSVLIISTWCRRYHVVAGNPNDGSIQNSNRPPANHDVIVIPSQLVSSALASGCSGFRPTTNYFINEEETGNVLPEKQPENHPSQITQARPTSALANRRQLTHVLSLNSYLFEHQLPYNMKSRLNELTRTPTNHVVYTPSPASKLPPRFPVCLPEIRGEPNDGFARESQHSLKQDHANQTPKSPKCKDILPTLPSSNSLRDFSGTIFEYEDLEKATNGFSGEDNFLGSGAFGSVYRGTLSNGKEIAVKLLKPDTQRAEQEFQAEVDTISHIRYTHLVSMIGCCISGDKRLLIYEFVPNNTLHFHLHGNGQLVMNWTTRVKIAKGSAKGLAYLHEKCDPRIIHRDIKACNILIDSDFNAKVADFGLAKLFPNSFTHLSTQLAGTFGYMDPEYYNSGKLTEKSDVYSFGVMLLELITGRKPKGLALWAKGESPDEESDYETLVDPRLQKNYNADEMVRMVACAAACTRRYRRVRPPMSQVIRILEGEGSLEELNRGINQFWDNSIGQYDGDLKKFWKNAFVSPNNSPTIGWGLQMNSPT